MTDPEAAPIEHRRPEANHRSPGRPRNPETDRAILRAAVDVLSEVGLQGITVSAVAERAGVARATIYLRWPTREALLGAVARAAGGGYPYPLTGDLETDIRAGVDFARIVMNAEHFPAVMPELIAAVMANPQQLSLDDVAPNRKRLAAEYTASAAAQGFDPSLDPNLAFDIVLGAGLIQILASRQAFSTRYAHQLADVIVAGLRAKAGHGSPDERRPS